MYACQMLFFNHAVLFFRDSLGSAASHSAEKAHPRDIALGLLLSAVPEALFRLEDTAWG
jgi:hypothetical protein